MQGRLLLAAAFALLLCAQTATAALLRYRMTDFSISHFSISSPPVSIADPDPNHPPPGAEVSLVQDSAPNPVLRKLLMSGDVDLTTHVPQLSGFIWISLNFQQGPTGHFTGTGSSASGIAWGTTTGWTITGSSFCHAMPSFICDLAAAAELATVGPDLRSTLYDIGTWVFHGTGFTSAAFVFFTSTLPGNSQVVLKGAFEPTGVVPALPLLGVGAVGASLFALGLAALRRRRL